MKFKKLAVMSTCIVTLAGAVSPVFAMAGDQGPKIESIGNAAADEKLQKEIQEKNINAVDEKNKTAITTTFEEKYRDADKLSFIIETVKTSGSSETIQYYYNTDLKTGKALTLQVLLGENYQELANKTIREQIQKRMAEDENQIFFGTKEEDQELGIEGFTSIKEDQTFYINKDGNVVITFKQFEIAPGYMGIPEFEIMKE